MHTSLVNNKPLTVENHGELLPKTILAENNDSWLLFTVCKLAKKNCWWIKL